LKTKLGLKEKQIYSTSAGDALRIFIRRRQPARWEVAAAGGTWRRLSGRRRREGPKGFRATPGNSCVQKKTAEKNLLDQNLSFFSDKKHIYFSSI
jgi:hypothetical protein